MSYKISTYKVPYRLVLHQCMALYVLPKYAVQSALLKNGKIVRALILSEEEAINEFI